MKQVERLRAAQGRLGRPREAIAALETARGKGVRTAGLYNALADYDWANKRYVESDIEDWRPDGSGRRQRINCDRWQGDSLKWFVTWMQSLPGAACGLTHEGKPLRNWWVFIGDFDRAMAQRMKLVGD